MTTKPKLCRRYLRSSKDRSDVSIEAQRHELAKFEAEQGLTCDGEYIDVVESGKDEDRPGFLELYADLRAPGRAWRCVTVYDTSRIARRRHIAVNFERECARRGVKVLYKSMAGIDPETEILIMGVFQSMDEWHSLVSKRKARAGMATNVRRGFRAGGRAPIGYKLAHIDTGAVRDGRPVLKSRLVLDDAIAPAMQRYLKARAAGTARPLALRNAGLDQHMAKSSLVGIEWNALTYAGTTVWNQNQEREAGGYMEGTKRRPRAEWITQPDTHPALITTEEAEHILAQLEAHSTKASRRTPADYLLTGLLKTPAGDAWKGQLHRYYRAGSRYATMRDVDASVLEQVAADLSSPDFAARILERVKKSAGGTELTEANKLRQAEASLSAQISRFMDMAVQLETPAPVLRKIDELERQRTHVQREMEGMQREAAAARASAGMTEDQVKQNLALLAGGMKGYDRERLKDCLGRMLSSITLEPGSDEFQLHYRIELSSRARRDARSLKVASPRDDAPKTFGRLTSYGRVKKAA